MIFDVEESFKKDVAGGMSSWTQTAGLALHRLRNANLGQPTAAPSVRPDPAFLRVTRPEANPVLSVYDKVENLGGRSTSSP